MENGIPPHIMSEVPIPQLVVLMCFSEDGSRYISQEEAFAIIAKRKAGKDSGGK